MRWSWRRQRERIEPSQLNAVLYGHGDGIVIHSMSFLFAASLFLVGCSQSGREPMPEIRRVASPCDGPCGADTVAASQTYPFLLPGQPELDDECLRSAVSKSGGMVEISFDLRASGSVSAVHIPDGVAPTGRACLQAWASALEFFPPHDCQGNRVAASTSLGVGLSYSGSEP